MVQEEYTTIQDIWRHHLDLLDYRRTELQDHYIDQGGDLKVFYSVLQTSRLHSTPNSSQSLSQGDIRDIERKEEVEEEEEEEEGVKSTSGELRAPVKTAEDFISLAALRDAEPPMLPKDFEKELEVP